MLAKFQPYLLPYGNGLIEMLSTMFFKYNELVMKVENGQISQVNNKNKNVDE